MTKETTHSHHNERHEHDSPYFSGREIGKYMLAAAALGGIYAGAAKAAESIYDSVKPENPAHVTNVEVVDLQEPAQTVIVVNYGKS